MLQFIAVSLVVCVGLQTSNADNNYYYHFKVTQFFADMMEDITEEVKSTQEEMNNLVRNKSSFKKAVEEFHYLIVKARGGPCDRTVDALNLQAYQNTFESSWENCVKDAGCKDDLAAPKEQFLKDVQIIDQAAFKSVSKCTNEDCKMKVYHNTQEELSSLYKKSMPGIRLAEDRVIAQTGCSAKILDCVIDRNQPNLKQIYTGIAGLETCLDQAQLNAQLKYYK